MLTILLWRLLEIKHYSTIMLTWNKAYSRGTYLQKVIFLVEAYSEVGHNRGGLIQRWGAYSRGFIRRWGHIPGGVYLEVGAYSRIYGNKSSTSPTIIFRILADSSIRGFRYKHKSAFSVSLSKQLIS